LLGAAVIVGGLIIPASANAVVSPQTLVLTTGWDAPHHATWSAGASGTFTLTLTRGSHEACFDSTFDYTAPLPADPVPTSTAINDARALADPATVIEFPTSDSAYAYTNTTGNTYHASGCRTDVSTATIDDIFAQAGTQAEDGAYVAVIYDQDGVVGIGGFLDESYTTSNVTINTKLCPDTIQTTGDLDGHTGDCTAVGTGFSYLVTDGVNLHSGNANADSSGSPAGSTLTFKNAKDGSTANVAVTVPGSNRFGDARGTGVANVSSTDFDVDMSSDRTVNVYLFRPPADTTAPTVTKPVVNFTTNVRYGPGGAKMRVSWTGADTAAVASYEIQRSLDGGAYTSLGTGLTSTFFDTAMSNGHKYRFRVQATDDANNKSSWSYSDSSTLRVVQDNSSSVKYTGSWGTGHSSTAASGTTHFASTAGRTAKLSFSGRAVAFVAPQTPTRGKAKIYIDGKYKTTIDLGGPLVPRLVEYTTRWSSAGSHSIMISVVGTSGRPRVDLDAYMYLQ